MNETSTQLDARSLVDVERLEAEVTAMYRHVARGNDYRFISERAIGACPTYAVEAVSLLATKRAH